MLNRAVIHIKENYVDPSRISERKMIGGAMDEVMRSVPEVLVETENDPQGLPKRITVRVDHAERIFELGDVDNLWQMSFKFKDIFRFVQENLKHFNKFQEIEYAAINGMLKTLDPHSVLMRPEDYREMKLSTKGKFGGLGIVIAIKETHLTVVNPIDDTPASKAGIKQGDRIVQINQDSTVNHPLQDAVDMLRGAPNTKVDIFIVRDGWKAPRKFTLTRANIRIASVDHKLLPDRVGLVRLKNFQNTTDEELGEALDEMKKQGHGLKGLVLDMRGNPGGLLDQAIKVADRFIESGDIVTTVGYGDLYPVTTPGRLAGVLLMIGGVALIGSLAGTLGSFFSPGEEAEAAAGHEADDDPPAGGASPVTLTEATATELLAELQRLRAEVAQLRRAEPGPDSDPGAC